MSIDPAVQTRIVEPADKNFIARIISPAGRKTIHCVDNILLILSIFAPEYSNNFRQRYP